MGMLIKVGWKKDFVNASVPVLPLSGWMGDNLIDKSTNMAWWTGCDVIGGSGEKMHVDTLKQCLNDLCSPPGRNDKAEMRMPVSGIYKIKGVGDVLAGRVEQGVVTTDTEVIFMPTHTAANACAGKVFTIEMHHKKHPVANPGEIKLGYSPIGFVRCGRSACRATAFKFK